MSSRTGRRFGALLTAAGLALSVLGVGAAGVAAAPLPKAAAVNDSCGYSDATFNENTVMQGAAVYGTGLTARIGAFATDEKGLLLGADGALLNTQNPEHASN